jgi:hypothetical protein
MHANHILVNDHLKAAKMVDKSAFAGEGRRERKTMNASASYPPLVPAFAVNDAAKAIDFYKAAFGAVERFRLIDPESKKSVMRKSPSRAL